MTTTTKVSGGFNPPHYRKYPGLAALRVALGMDEAAFEKHVRKLIGKAAVEELERHEKEADMQREIADLKRTLNRLRRFYPKEYSEVMEARRHRGLKSKSYFPAVKPGRRS